MSNINLNDKTDLTNTASKIVFSNETNNFLMTDSSNYDYLNEIYDSSQSSEEDSALYGIEENRNEITKNIISFRDLSFNWNSYGSNKVCLKCIDRAIKTVNIFENKGMSIKFAYPLQDGGIQLELNTNDYFIEMEVNPKNFQDQIVIFDKDDNVIFEKTEPQLSIYTIEEAIQKIL